MNEYIKAGPNAPIKHDIKRNFISIEAYEEDVLRTWKEFKSPTEEVSCAALGLAGEAGEVAELFKKMLYHGHPYSQEKIVDELGDVLYYMVIIMKKNRITLSEVIEHNVAKRRARYPAGFDSEKSINRG